MTINVQATTEAMSRAAAARAADILRSALDDRGSATFVIATGNSQLGFLGHLIKAEGIDWSRTTMFHLDEYVGIATEHPASFVRYLQDRFVRHVSPGTVHFINGAASDPEAERRRISNLLNDAGEVDVAFVGIGENGHLAFNDPPADFETTDPFLLVQLDDACRRQQVGEGWFESLDMVPRQAITMSIRQIVAARHIVCTVPDERKAAAVADCLSERLPVSPERPASILRTHDECTIFLDAAAASRM